MSDKKSNSNSGTVHPAFLAAAAVAGIGCAIYSIFSARSEEPPHEECRNPPPPTSSPKTEQYDTNPSLLKNKGKEEDECPICLNALKGIVRILDCSHSFHLDCLNKWIQPDDAAELNNTCPICRRDMN